MTTIESIKAGAFKELQSIPKIEGSIWSLKFSPDNSFLTMGCQDGSLYFLNLATNTISSKLVEVKNTYRETVTAQISSIAMPVSKKIIIAATKMGIAILDYSGTNLFTSPLEGWMWPVVKVTPGEKTFAVSDDKRIILYDMDPFRKSMEIETGGYSIGLEYNADGSLLFAGGDQGKSIHAWGPYGAKESDIKAHSGIILSLALGKDGHLISGAEDFTIKKWDVATGDSIPVKGFANGKENQIQFSPDYSVVGTASLSRQLALRDPDTLETIHQVHFNDYCTALDFSRDGKMLAAADKSGALKIWQIG